MAKMYAIVGAYVKMESPRVSKNTSDQRVDVLCRVLDKLTRDYGVRVTSDNKIYGMSAQVLADFYSSMIDAGRKMTTLNYYVNMLNPFLRWCKKLGVFADATQQEVENITTILTNGRLPSIDMVPEDERPIKYITHEQAQQLLTNTSGRNVVRDRAIIALLLYSGLRATELCSLTIGSILDRPRGETYVKRKGGKWCTVLIGEAAYPYLEAYLATRKDADHSEPLFLTTHGKPCTRIQIYKALAHKQESVGAAKGPHALRHSFISEADRAGGAAIARDLANQHSLYVTNRYDHTTKEQRRAAIDRIAW